MKINWNNVFAAFLGLAAIVFFLRYRHAALEFLSTAKRIGPGHSPEDLTLGLLVIGICGAVLVAIVRLLINNRRD